MPAVGGDQQQHSMAQISRLLGRPKCFSGREDEWHDHGLPKKPVLICPNEVEEAEDPGHEELDESMPEPDVVPRGVAVPETPSDKDREAHELTHLPTQPWCSVCVFEPKGLTNGISEGQLVNVQRPKEWITYR